MFSDNVLNIKENSIILDYGVLQHLSDDHNDRLDNTYIMHLAGRDNNARYTVSNKHLNLINTGIIENFENNQNLLFFNLCLLILVILILLNSNCLVNIFSYFDFVKLTLNKSIKKILVLILVITLCLCVLI